jgi:hypothetical protein
MLKSNGEVSVKKIITLVFTVFIVIMMIALSGQIFETNKAGHFQVKQAALSGDMSVRLESGTYLQMFWQH